MRRFPGDGACLEGRVKPGRDAVLRHSVQIVVLAGLLLGIAAPLSADTWYEHYTTAEEALEDGEWRRAVDHLNRALEKKGDSGVRVRIYGMKFISYFPYLKLGVAYYELGQVDEALQAFETEERLGAIAGSATDLQELSRYRELAMQARETESEAEAARIAAIVEESLTRARRLEREGLLEDAIGALGNALAVAPDDSDALAMLSSLRTAATRRQEESARAERATVLLEAGRAHLDAGDLSEAASALRQSLSFADSEEARDLLGRAQTRLRQELESREIERQAEMIDGILADAASLESSGRLEEALDSLQSVLVLDPENQEARALESRLLQARQLAEEEQERRRNVVELLAAAARLVLGQDLRTGGRDPAMEEIARRLFDVLRDARYEFTDSEPALGVAHLRRSGR